jgi:hypothetical protein
MLYAALAAYDDGKYIIAAIRLREAARRFMVAACEWYGCTPTRMKFPTPKEYVRSLRKGKHLDKWGAKVMLEAVECGNRAAHCRPLDSDSIRGCISILFCMMDGEPYIDHVRNPIVTSYDPKGFDCDNDGDNDSADWWKRTDGSEGGDA